jgi:hypothetical protein
MLQGNLQAARLGCHSIRQRNRLCIGKTESWQGGVGDGKGNRNNPYIELSNTRVRCFLG